MERSFLDSKFEGVDDDFIILADGDFANFVETETTSQSRTLSIDVPSGTEEIEIIGSVFGDSSSVLVVDIPEPVVETPEPVVETPEPSCRNTRTCCRDTRTSSRNTRTCC